MIGYKRNKRQDKNSKRFGKLVVISLFIILVTVSASQALIKLNISGLEKTIDADRYDSGNGTPPMPLDDPFFTWEDNFDTNEWIDPDPTMSYDYEVVDGTVEMKNTYTLWTDPDWEKIKPVEISNSDESLYNYALHLTVEYDSDMQSDYDDLRFKHENAGNV